MHVNMGVIDRSVRAVAGVPLIAWALMGGPMWAWIGVLPLATAATGFCPGYVPFGISTCGKK
ncbi:MAG: DUF2892 domain-containing protein [Acidobacteria bacterium]|nr:DUF2892 domain-containing protein [Planctomycetota bacterium]MBE3133462.1 DUF2892 domain-containing protein [Acidobacteriota bacterium]